MVAKLQRRPHPVIESNINHTVGSINLTCFDQTCRIVKPIPRLFSGSIAATMDPNQDWSAFRRSVGLAGSIENLLRDDNVKE